MTREQEIRNTLADGVLVAAVAADELALDDLRLHEQGVQVAQQRPARIFATAAGGILRLGLRLQLLHRRRLGREGREPELFVPARKVGLG